LTQSAAEAELDQVCADMALDDVMGAIGCPTLMLAGEYDLRDPIEEVFRLFDLVQAPAELWVFADQFHRLAFAGANVYETMLDWLADRLAGRAVQAPGQVRYIEPTSAGPVGPDVTFKRRWYEEGLPTVG
jgi:hypothetical protein